MLDSGGLTFLLGVDVVVSRAFPQEGAPTAVRRYELMLVFRPDAPDERISAIIDRTTRQITAAGGQIVKVAPWGRRRLAYAIDRHREGAYHIVVFESPTEAIAELERDLLITEELLRHLTIRQDRPARAMRDSGSDDEGDDESLLPSAEDEEEDDDGRERIDESETEAAPAAID